MRWIKVQTTLIDDPAVAAIGERLRMPEPHVVGCLVSIWGWADALTADGFVQHATAALIDKKAGKKGFAEAMSSVGWLLIEPAGITFPKWDRHNGESAKARAGEAEAKRLSRAGVRRSGPDALSAHAPARQSRQNKATTSGQMSGQPSGQNTDKCPDQIREEKIREENTNTYQSSSTGSTDRPPEAVPDLALEPTPPPPPAEPTPEAIYDAYPRKQGRQDALKAIAKAIRVSTAAHLLERTTAYAAATETWNDHDRQFIPHPATWFNRGSYDDDPQTWVRSYARPDQLPASDHTNGF